MSTPATERRLPPQVRRRIADLEASVGKLETALGVVVREIRRAGVVLDLPKHMFRDVVDKSPKGGPGEPSDSAVQVPAAGRCAAARSVAGSGLAGALSRGEAARVEWVRSGEVVPAKALANAWGLTPQALGPAARRGEVFAVNVKNQRYYPSEFLVLRRHDVGEVCRALARMDPAEQLVFWKRRHGALAGKTVAEVLASGKEGGSQLAKVVRLARARAAQAHPDAAEVS